MAEDKINWTNSSKVLVADINSQLQRYKEKGMLDMNEVSDGYHTFGELYEHRIELYIALCKQMSIEDPAANIQNFVWKSKVHSDGSVWDGWFILGYGTQEGEQITYHLPMNYFPQCKFAQTLDKAPDWDGHTSADVLERLKSL